MRARPRTLGSPAALASQVPPVAADPPAAPRLAQPTLPVPKDRPTLPPPTVGRFPRGRREPLERLQRALLRAGVDPGELRRRVAALPPCISPALPCAVSAYVAHPDDESMYAGGTLSRIRENGHPAAVVLLTHGEGGRLLARDASGRQVEDRSRPRAEVVRIRDRELAQALGSAGLDFAHLFPAAIELDFAYTTSLRQTFKEWEARAPDGLGGIVRRLVDDLRARRPAVVLTLDSRNDPGDSEHGHHKALGLLVELAAALAGDPALPGGAAHAIDELWTCAPAKHGAHLTVPVRVEARQAMLQAYGSQLEDSDLRGLGSRPEERFVLRVRRDAAPRGALTRLLGGG